MSSKAEDHGLRCVVIGTIASRFQFPAATKVEVLSFPDWSAFFAAAGVVKMFEPDAILCSYSQAYPLFSAQLAALSHPREAPEVRSEAGPSGIRLRQRHVEILKLLRAGQRNSEIASHLGLCVGTVKNYIRDLFRLLNVSSRTELLSSALDLGLLDVPVGSASDVASTPAPRTKAPPADKPLARKRGRALASTRT